MQLPAPIRGFLGGSEIMDTEALPDGRAQVGPETLEATSLDGEPPNGGEPSAMHRG